VKTFNLIVEGFFLKQTQINFYFNTLYLPVQT